MVGRDAWYCTYSCFRPPYRRTFRCKASMCHLPHASPGHTRRLSGAPLPVDRQGIKHCVRLLTESGSNDSAANAAFILAQFAEYDKKYHDEIFDRKGAEVIISLLRFTQVRAVPRRTAPHDRPITTTPRARHVLPVYPSSPPLPYQKEKR